MTNTSNIKTKNWSLSLINPGEVVTDLDSINQCIYTIVTTVRGTDPYNSKFGCGLFLYVDKPVNVAIPNMVREIGNAIALFEPRATVTKIEYKLDISSVEFSIYWTSNLGSSITSVPVTLK